MGVCRDFAINIEEREVLRLLGYGSGIPNHEVLLFVREEIPKSMEYIKPALVYEEVGISEVLEDKVVLENGVAFEGKYIAEKLKRCKWVVVSAATLGTDIDEEIKSAFEEGDYLRGMVLDNIGLCAIDQVNKIFWSTLVEGIRGSSIGITSGLSPGTWEWDVSAQRQVFACLDTGSISLKLTESNMMVPLKSTSVVYGFGEGIGIARAEHKCSQCNLKKCIYRLDEKVQVDVRDQNGNRKVLYANRGDNLLEVLRNGGVFVSSLCGGKGTCGKCRVQFIKGVPALSQLDERHLSQGEIQRGIRLSCACSLDSSAEIIVPHGHEKMDIMTSGIEINSAVKPHVIKKYVILDAPSLEDQRTDIERLSHGLGIENLKVSRKLMSKISDILREGDFKVTAALYKNNLLDLEAKDTSGKAFGIAVDIGTTTIACYLVDLKSGMTVDVESAVNRQRAYGADVISRINYTMENEKGLSTLNECIITQINEMIETLCRKNGIDRSSIYNMAAAGNTTMIHLFLGLPCKNISLSPYIPVITDTVEMHADELNININGYVTVLPGISAYVGSDITCGILASGMYKKEGLSLLLDLGTNGEIALGNKDGIITCSTAAGPAFEGANIKWGVGGIKGAISRVDLSKEVIYETIGGAKPLGICGSGVLDMVSELLKYGLIDETGRMMGKEELHCSQPLKDRVVEKEKTKGFLIDGEIIFTQKDVREVQLAKAAVSAGIKILMKDRGIIAKDVECVYIAGGFGNFVNVDSALNIGLLPREFSGKIKSIGNSAGSGARMCILSKDSSQDLYDIIKKTTYVELSGRQDFQDYFIDGMMMG